MPAGAAQLTTQAFNRLFQAYRPSTQRTYPRMFSDYMAFLVVSGLPPAQVDVHILLAFLEYLYQNNCTVSNIANYLAAIRALSIIYDLPTECFKHQKIQFFIRSLKLNRPLTLKSHSALDEHMLHQVIMACHQLQNPLVFSAIYLLAFFSFLRLSNIVPHSTSKFDVSRHLARGDIIFGQDLAIILVKWSKTNQFRDKVAKISIPVLSNSSLCPVASLKTLLQAVPGTQNDPLFTIFKQDSFVPLTDSMVRKHFKRIINILHWQHFKFTFHSFRRSGASWAYQHGVPIHAIKQQGTWASDCVWRYISTQTNHSPLLHAFHQHLLS